MGITKVIANQSKSFAAILLYPLNTQEEFIRVLLGSVVSPHRELYRDLVLPYIPGCRTFIYWRVHG